MGFIEGLLIANATEAASSAAAKVVIRHSDSKPGFFIVRGHAQVEAAAAASSASPRLTAMAAAAAEAAVDSENNLRRFLGEIELRLLRVGSSAVIEYVLACTAVADIIISVGKACRAACHSQFCRPS